MKFKPYDYQATAIEWVITHPQCGLFLDMGLGKSVITLTAIRRLMDCCEVSRALVVAPKKVAESTWTDEAGKWDHLHSLRVSAVLGSASQRIAALGREADVYVIGRDSFVWLVNHFRGSLPFDMLILDELTSFKSPRSLRFKAVRAARKTIPRIVGLTGTPAPNGLIDLWAQIYCLDGGERLGRYVTHYREAYFTPIQHNGIVFKYVPRRGSEEAIRGRIADICLSMQSRDYLQLPEMLTHDIRVPLPPKIREGYAAFEREQVLDFAILHRKDAAPVYAASAAALMNKLSQYCNGAVYDEEHTACEVHGCKLDTLSEIVEGAAGSGVLVFYQYRHDIERILGRLKGYRTAVYEGPEQLRAWNAGELDVLLAHPASAAYGLNMQQGGHYIVWFGLTWNLEQYQQANARLHRQGQRHPVTVYRLLCADTVEERALCALDSKSGTQQSLMDSLNYLLTKHAPAYAKG